MRRVLAERARVLAVPRSEPPDEGELLHLVVRVGQRSIAIPAERTRHVMAATPLTQLVQSGAAMSGLAVVLGELVPVADLATLLQVDHGRKGSHSGYFVLVEDDVCPVGLHVDEVVGLQTVSPRSIVHDVAVGGSGHGILNGIAPGGLHLLDLDAALGADRMWPADRAPTP